MPKTKVQSIVLRLETTCAVEVSERAWTVFSSTTMNEGKACDQAPHWGKKKFLSTFGHAWSRSAPYFLPFPPFLVDPPGNNQSKTTKFPPFWRPVSSRAGRKLRNINENGYFQVSFFTSWSLRVTRNFNFITSPKVQKTSIFIAMKEKIKTRSYLCCENCERAALCVRNINR